MILFPPDLTPGDLAVLNNLVILTDLTGIAFGVCAGMVWFMPGMARWIRIMLMSLLIFAGYQIINVWA